MKIKFPLYVKILFWFFLNMVFLAAVFLTVAHFKLGLDALVSGPAAEHLQSVIRLLEDDLRERPRGEWDDVMKKFSEANRVQFRLFRNDGELLAGRTNLPVPREVRERLAGPRGGGGQPFGPGRGMGPPGGRRGGMQEPPPEMDAPPGQFPPPRGGRGGQFQPDGQAPPQRSILHTTTPNLYWVVFHLGIPNPGGQPPMTPAVLVISSESLGAGGLFFDATPWVLAGLAVMVISALFWFPLVRGITRSISQMTRTTERIAQGQFDVRTEVARQDELGSLNDAINRMASRLAGLVSGQKRFLGDIAHELCSPIARIQVALGILEQRADGRQKEYVKDLREEVEQMAGLVNELLSFSRASLGKADARRQPVLARAVAEKAVARECGAGGGEIRVNVPEDLRVMAEPELLLRAVANVLRNAIRYAGSAGPITISAERAGDQVWLAVEDCGPGIPETAREQVFDPFYRLDSSRTRDTGGVGLGLSIVKTCVESCGGTVGCENRQTGGLRVVMKLAAGN